MEKIAVSVIVPIYNVEKYIRQCIDSIIGQTLRDIEIILVDDGSPDNCPSIVDEYAVRDKRIIVIHKKNGGVSAARNDGLDVAKGEYVFICDSDDWMFPDALEKMYACAKKYDADSVIADHVNHHGEKTTYTKAFLGTNDFIALERRDIEVIQSSCMTYNGIFVAKKERRLFSAFRNNGAPWMHLYRRALIANCGLKYDIALKGIFDDIWFNLHFYERANKVAYISVPVYHYRIVVGSITKKFKADLLETYSNVFRRVEGFLKNKGNRDEFMLPLFMRKIAYLDRMMSYYFLNDQNPKDGRQLRKEFRQVMHSEFKKELLKYGDVSRIERKKARIVMWLLKNQLFDVYWYVRKHTSLLNL